MPDYDHQCQSKECGYEWEETYSIKADPPKICPKCKQETAKRVISLCGRGVVELVGQDLVDHVKADAKRIAKEAAKDDKKYANLLGESKYEQLQQRMDRQKR